MAVGVWLDAFPQCGSRNPSSRLCHKRFQPQDLGGEASLWRGGPQNRELGQSSVQLGLALGCASHFCTDAEM